MNEWGVIGHDAVVRRLQAAIAGRQTAQANLIVGPASVGKTTLAHAFTCALLGVDERTRRLLDAGRHPDVLALRPEEDKNSIGIDPTRAWLRQMTLAPVEGAYRVGLIGHEQAPTEEAQNAILKTLEQPPPSVVIVITALSVDELLSTIVSRCQVIGLRPAPYESVRTVLCARGASDESADRIARLARGRVGWALAALDDERVLVERDARVDELEGLLRGGATERFAFADKLSKKKDKSASADESPVRVVLGEWLLFWRDVAASFGRVSTQSLRNSDRQALLQSVRERISLIEVRRILELHTHTMQNIERNANVRLSLDVLLMNLPRLRG
jgi:DNA polymerase-3 subunit delta'